MNPDPKDAAIADACMRWSRVAQDEIEDIGCWRSADADDRHHRYWTTTGRGDTAPQGFIGDTNRIIMAITAELPGVDLNAIQTILGAVQSWHDTRSADDLPAQGLLDMKLTMALSSVSALKHKADIRIVAAQHPQPVASEEGDSEDKVFKPVKWFDDQYSLDKSWGPVLSGLHRRGKISRRGDGKPYQYSAMDVHHARPDLIPDRPR